MKRHISSSLLKWKNSPDRMPLIIKGVRQCGKTWILKEFGNENFTDTAYFNFEGNDALFSCFTRDMNPERIIKELGTIRGKAIIPETTFVIFDEIQFCPNALTSLKYFAEELPKLHIACAGSLLGISLAKPLSFPVGKVDLITMYPMNFAEFLNASGHEMLYESLLELKTEDSIPESYTGLLKDAYDDYLITGGMPKAVLTWLKTHDIEAVENVLKSILDTYELDFAKHAPISEVPRLSLIWRAIPSQLAKESGKFIFSHVKTGSRARDLEDALQWLIDAGLVYKIERVGSVNIPLSASADSTYFKIYMCDAGLLRKMSGFPVSALKNSESEFAYMRGAAAENFVLTELMSSGVSQPYFWKSKRGAEVDFVFQDGMNIVPVEVKAGVNTKSKSLAEYRKNFSPAVSVKISLQDYKRGIQDGKLLIHLPLYFVWRIKEIIQK